MTEISEMTTDKQIAANRANARKATGPKTAAGKAIAKLNDVKHGGLSPLPVRVCTAGAPRRAHRLGAPRGDGQARLLPRFNLPARTVA
jgi:hypothetical protein